MGIIEALDETSSEAAEKGQAYVHTTKKYYELKVFQQLAILSSTTCKVAIYGVLFALGLIFSAIAAASALTVYFGSAALGFLTVGLVFFVCMGTVYLFRKNVEKLVVRKLSENYFDQ